MTRGELEGLRGLKNEIRLLERELRNLPEIRDSVRGSMSEYPYIQRVIPIHGVDTQRGSAIRQRLIHKQRLLQDMVCEMEEWLDKVENPDMRSILRLKYRNGLTYGQIGRELGYSEKTVRRRIKKFWAEN